MIAYHMHRRDVPGNLPIHMRHKGDTFHLPFPLGCGSVDLACPCIKTSQEMQGALADVLVFDSHWLARLCRQGRGLARPRLQTGFLVHAQDHFPSTQRTRIPGHHLLDLGSERRIPRDVGRQPQRMAPGFQLVVRQHPLDRRWRDGLHDAVADPLPGQLRALPLRQGTPNHVRTLAGQLDHLPRHHWGKNRPPAGSFVVVPTVEAIRDKAQRPLADMPFASLTLSGGGGKGVSLSSQQDGPRSFGETNRGFLPSEPSRQRGAGGLIDLHMER
jgi:hypothetical protein